MQNLRESDYSAIIEPMEMQMPRHGLAVKRMLRRIWWKKFMMFYKDYFLSATGCHTKRQGDIIK